LDSQILLAKTLGEPTSFLFAHFDDEIKNSDWEKFQKFIHRRIKAEPVAYIIGEKEFYKRTFLVNPHVLIPRPATETLIELAIQKSKEQTDDCWFADIGTGSGAIAITLAAETGLPVIACDISSEALTVAKTNAEKSGVTALIDFRQGDLLEPLIKIFQALKNKPQENSCNHLIICANLPYLNNNQWKTLDSGVREFEPQLALIAGHDGLDLYWRLFRDLKKYRQIFPSTISLLLEIDPDQVQKITAMIGHDFSGTEPQVIKDLEGLDRVVMMGI
jgi:release factor glutamine methyltransferase